MKTPTEKDLKVYRRLRNAYRRGMTTVMKKNGSAEEAKKVCGLITARAVRLGWLELPTLDGDEHP